MFPSLGFGETLVIVLLAIIVVGPKDLPVLMRKVGGFIRQIKAMGQEFRDAFDEMGAEDEIKELQREIEALKNMPAAELEQQQVDIMQDMTALDTELRDVATDVTKP